MMPTSIPKPGFLKDHDVRKDERSTYGFKAEGQANDIFYHDP